MKTKAHSRGNGTDKVSMPFQIIAAYSIATLAILVLGGFAVQNRLAGWRRARLTMLDVLLARAMAKTQAQQSTDSSATLSKPVLPASPPIIQDQLSALAFALNSHGQVTPSPSKREPKVEALEKSPMDVTLKN